MNRIITAVFLLTIGACGNNPTFDQSLTPNPDVDVSQPTPESANTERTADGVWFLTSTEDPGQEFHLLGEPFRVGFWSFTLSVENEFPKCVSPIDGQNLDNEVTEFRPAHTVRPVTVTENNITMRFTMDFQPSWHTVFDELHNERDVEVFITGTPVPSSSDPGLEVFDVTIERLYVISGFTMRSTGTLSHFNIEPWFRCD